MEIQDHKENKPPNVCGKSNLADKVIIPTESNKKNVAKVDGSVDSEKLASHSMTAGMSNIGPGSEKIFQLPLRANNSSSTKSKDQVQLLQKFRQLRQWQQQQQENMFMQQQQHLEILKREQDKLQNIIATQKLKSQQSEREQDPVRQVEPHSGIVSRTSQDSNRTSLSRVDGRQVASHKVKHPVQSEFESNGIHKSNELVFSSAFDANPSSITNNVMKSLTEVVGQNANAHIQDLQSLQRISRNERGLWSPVQQTFTSIKSNGILNNDDSKLNPQSVTADPDRITSAVDSNGITLSNATELLNTEQRTFPISWQSRDYAIPLGKIPQTSLSSQPRQMQTFAQQLQSKKVVPMQLFHPSSSSSTVYKLNPTPAVSVYSTNNSNINTVISEDPRNSLLISTSHSDIDVQSEQSDADALSGVFLLRDTASEGSTDGDYVTRCNEVLQEGCDTELEDQENDVTIQQRSHNVDTEIQHPRRDMALQINGKGEETEAEVEERDMTTLPITHKAKHIEQVKNSDKEKIKTDLPNKSDEDRPIQPGIGAGTTSFEALLEKQLQQEQENTGGGHAGAPKVTRTFLRKGDGLARFRVKPKAPTFQKKNSKGIAVKQQPDSNESKADKELLANSLQLENKKKPPDANHRKTTLNKMTRKVAVKTPPAVSSGAPEYNQSYGSSTLASRVIGPFNSAMELIVADQTTPSTAAIVKTVSPNDRLREVIKNKQALGLLDVSVVSSLQEKLQEWEKNQELEEEELEEFEMLEEAAANSSLSSNSSVVVRMLAKAKGNVHSSRREGKRGSNPNTPYNAVPIDTVAMEKPIHLEQSPRGVLSPVDTGYASSDVRALTSENTSEQNDDNSHLELISENDYSDDGEDTVRECSSEKTLTPSANGSGLTLVDMKNFGTQLESSVVGKADEGITEPNQSKEEFDDEETWGEIKETVTESSSDDETDDAMSDIHPLITSTPPYKLTATAVAAERINGDVIASSPPTSSLVTKLFPQLKPKQKQVTPSPHLVQKESTGVSGDTSTNSAVHSTAIREKLKELDAEIERFRAENAALTKARVEREEGLARLQTEIEAFEKQKKDELERLEKFRDEELLKLRREKRVFEKYQKAAHAMPDKRERDEIENLQNQINDLQDELKRRESRWLAATARYRDKIESLEQKNKELQEEVKLLEKYRLERWQTEVKDTEETKPRKVLQRKVKSYSSGTSGSVQMESVSPSLARPQPRKPTFVENIEKPRQDTDFSPVAQVEAHPLQTDRNVNRALKEKDSSYQELMVQKPPLAPAPPNRLDQSDQAEPGEKSRTVHFEDESENSTRGQSNTVDNASTADVRREQQEIVYPDGKVEKVNSDGSRVIRFSNGTRKEISADGQSVIVTFFNGDMKQVMPDQRLIYYYAEAQTTHTTYPDGLEVLQFPSNQIEKHYPDGTKEIIFPDQTVKYLHANGAEECIFADGTVQRVSADGERTLEFPNGQREIHTKYFKKREYPDGTVKTVFQDGRTETRYSTGRLRVKDREGRVLVDTAEQVK